MKEAEFVRLEYGLESGSDTVLKAMNKLFSVSEAEEIIRTTHMLGIETVIYLIVGFPNETDEEFDKTIYFIRKNASYIDLVKSVNPLYIMAGSPIYKNINRYNIELPSENPDFCWSIAEENTYDIRLAKVEKIRQILDELKISYAKEDNQFERKIESVAVSREEVDILLVTMPPWGVENPPVGLAYLDCYIRSKGLKTLLYDFNIYFHNTIDDAYKILWHVENKNFWSNEKTFPLICELFKSQIDFAVNKLLSQKTNLFGFSVVDPKERLTIEVIKRIKNVAPEKKIILGGPACSTAEQRDFFIKNIPGQIDYFVVGEGEETLFEIIERSMRCLDNNHIPGVAIKDNGCWSYLPRTPIEPIDTIPFPIYDGFELNQYKAGTKSLLVEWSRGCIGRCGFCKNYTLVDGYRARRPESVIKELEFVTKHYGIKEVTICDNLINGDIKQLHGICDRLIENNLGIRWSGQITPRKEMSYELFSKMYKAGCFKVQLGVESGSDTVLHKMNKFYTKKTAQDNLRQAKKTGMFTEIFIMVGFPGEGEKEFKETCSFIKNNVSYIDAIKSINTLHLIAGTNVYGNSREYNLKPLPDKNWHYLWETFDGNIYEKRRERVERLLDLSYRLGIRVMETNIREGKESLAGSIELKDLTINQRIEKLKIEINRLQLLPEGEARTRRFKKHPIWKFALLGFVFLFTIAYMSYFWLFKKIRGEFLLGGD